MLLLMLLVESPPPCQWCLLVQHCLLDSDSEQCLLEQCLVGACHCLLLFAAGAVLQWQEAQDRRWSPMRQAWCVAVATGISLRVKLRLAQTSDSAEHT
jgi:hypothetical protein